MADLPIVNFLTQWGPETTFGTGVAATKVLTSLGLSRFSPMGSGKQFRAQGNKLPSASTAVGRRRTEANLQGFMDFNELVYVLCAGIKNVTPTSDGTNGKKWTFTYALSGADVKKGFTIESGDTVHAQKSSSNLVTDITLDMSWENAAISGKLVGQALQDDITITPALTPGPLVVMNPATFGIKTAALQASLTAASEFTRPFSAQLTIPGILQPLNRMSTTDTSHVAMIEQALEGMRLKLVTGADDADMAFLANWTAGSIVWFRVQNLGAVIAGAIPSAYNFELDMACKVIDPYTPGELNGAATAEWNFNLEYDATSAYAFRLAVTNTLASL